MQEKFKPKRVPAANYDALRPAAADDKRMNVQKYQQAIGSLMYAMVLTRPDVSFVLRRLAQFMGDPATMHGHAPKSLMRYLRSTVTRAFVTDLGELMRTS